MTQLTFDGPRLERLGGCGPVQPVWDDISRYTAEWYRRFRVWHHREYPDSDAVTRANLDMLVEWAEEEDLV